MFRDELEELVRAYPGRFRVVHVLSEESAELASGGGPGAEVVSGRIDGHRLSLLVREHAGRPVEWYVAGPPALVDHVSTTLPRLGADPAHVHQEAFTTAD